MPPIVIAAGIGLAGAVGGAAISANAAGNAADAQVGAVNSAAQLQKQASDATLFENQRQFNKQQANLQPYLQSGYNALGALNYGLGLGSNTIDLTKDQYGTYSAASLNPSANTGTRSISDQITDRVNYLGSLLGSGNASQAEIAQAQNDINQLRSQLNDGTQTSSPNTLSTSTVPTTANVGGTGLEYGSLLQNFDPSTVQLDPSFDLMLQKGLKAIQNSGAAKGSGIGGSTLNALSEKAQDYTKTGYNDAYARQFNTFQTNQANRYNRLAALSGSGQITANQMNTASQNYANNNANLLTSGANTQSDLLTQAANARASGYVGQANALNQGIGTATNGIMNAWLMNKMLQNQNYGDKWGGADGPLGGYTG